MLVANEVRIKNHVFNHRCHRKDRDLTGLLVEKQRKAIRELVVFNAPPPQRDITSSLLIRPTVLTGIKHGEITREESHE